MPIRKTLKEVEIKGMLLLAESKIDNSIALKDSKDKTILLNLRGKY